MYYVDESNVKGDNQCFSFGLKNISHMKKEPLIATPFADIKNKRKREEFEKESNLDLLAVVSGESLEKALPTDENAKSGSDSMHSALTLQVTLQG